MWFNKKKRWLNATPLVWRMSGKSEGGDFYSLRISNSMFNPLTGEIPEQTALLSRRQWVHRLRRNLWQRWTGKVISRQGCTVLKPWTTSSSRRRGFVWFPRESHHKTRSERTRMWREIWTILRFFRCFVLVLFTVATRLSTALTPPHTQRGGSGKERAAERASVILVPYIYDIFLL